MGSRLSGPESMTEAPATPPRAETVTFLFTDIEGSTRLLQQLGDRYPEVLAEQMDILRKAVRNNGGVAFGSEGDALFASFASPRDGVAAAVDAQRALAAHPWPPGVSVRIRIGLHTGEATRSPEGYVGLDVHRAARVTGAGHGGQVLVSEATRVLVGDQLPEGVDLRDLGEHRLKDLARPERIYQLVIPGLPTEFPPLKSLDAVPHNLPTQLTSFVGRERELAQAAELLARSRLLTFTGPGGSGKTRLSLQLAAESTDHFPQGVFFVSLAPLFQPELVPSAIVQALGLQDAGGVSPKERLLEYLRDRHLLLVLDNFEQILEAAPLVAELLQAAPRVKTVVTSRAPLHVSGEQEYPVPPLGVPNPAGPLSLESLSQYEAVRLFIERAAAVRPDFRVTNDNASAIAEIVFRLDGLPLAIELAAARVKLISPEAILSRLEKRLTLLSGGPRDLPLRHQTLRDAIAWSFDLLHQPIRRLAARLAVFVGGCFLEQAEVVCGPAEELGEEVDGLAELVDHSLLREEEHGGEIRFLMLETIREFCEERLEESSEAGEIRRRHARAYLDLIEQAAPRLLGKEQGYWLDRLEQDHDNFRVALGGAVQDRDANTALRLAAGLWRFWQMRGHILEGRERLEEILGMPGADRPTGVRASALEAAGGLAYWQGNRETARESYEESLAIMRELGEPADIANALYNLSFTKGLPGETTQADSVLEARALLEEALEIYQGLGDRSGEAKVRFALSTSYFREENFEPARPHLEESLRMFRELDDVFHIGWALFMLGDLEIRTGNLPGARAHLEESLPLFLQGGDVSGVALHLDAFARLAMGAGDAERAVRLAAAAAALGRKSGATLFEAAYKLGSPARPGDAPLSEEDKFRIWEEGQAMTPEEAAAYALGASERAP
jgi:predicted ATPase/class 3 adenylate cyclase